MKRVRGVTPVLFRWYANSHQCCKKNPKTLYFSFIFYLTPLQFTRELNLEACDLVISTWSMEKNCHKHKRTHSGNTTIKIEKTQWFNWFEKLHTSSVNRPFFTINLVSITYSTLSLIYHQSKTQQHPLSMSLTHNHSIHTIHVTLSCLSSFSLFLYAATSLYSFSTHNCFFYLFSRLIASLLNYVDTYNSSPFFHAYSRTNLIRHGHTIIGAHMGYLLYEPYIRKLFYFF